MTHSERVCGFPSFETWIRIMVLSEGYGELQQTKNEMPNEAVEDNHSLKSLFVS